MFQWHDETISLAVARPAKLLPAVRARASADRNLECSISHILVCAKPAPGHVNPMLAIASSLASRGYDNTITTSDVLKSKVEAAGLRFIPLQGKANFDYRALDRHFPQCQFAKPGVEHLTHDFQHAFIDMIPDQHRTIEAIHRGSSVDLVLTDTTFLGTFPQLLDRRLERPSVISFGITALWVTSRDRPPIGTPEAAGDQSRDYLPQHREFQAALRPVDDYLAQLLTGMGVPPPSTFFMDAMINLPDCYLQLTGSSFEFPCSDLPGNVRFVGPVTPRSGADFEEPAWWSELDSGKPVVLVTQGTIANKDFSELIEPTVRALSTEDVIVVAALGTNESRSLSAPLPPNVHVVPFVPFDRLMPKVDVFVTNGGYGAVNQSLQNGVPLVVAGTTEDKPFIAARVAWSGSGLDLQTERPSPDQLRSVVHSVLNDPSFKSRARQIADSFSHYDALETIAAEVECELQIAAASDMAEFVFI